MADSKEKLFSDFPGVSTEAWMEKITADLKGADFEKKLVWKTNEGFKVKPFYRQEDLEGLKTTEGLPGQFPYVRGIKKDDNTWLVRQDIQVECPKEANAKALDILNKGIDSLGFKVNAKDLNAMIGSTAPFMVMETDILFKGMPSNNTFMFSSEQIDTPALPTSPTTR